LERATGAGVAAGLLAFLLWPAFLFFGKLVLAPFLIALAGAALCGASMLWITIVDLLTHRRRGERLRPVRAFDVVLALLLTVPPLLELRALLPL
jgi:polyferredoxin